MKLTEEEMKQVQWAQQNNAMVCVPRLAAILKDSALPRDILCHMLAGVFFRALGGDEEKVREELYRTLTVAEATLEGRLKL